MYLTNESSVGHVYFDDIKVTLHETNIVQENAYYPFGLPLDDNPFFYSFVPNRFLYQGKEWQTSLALNLYDFHARQYDPALGRWLAMDPAGQFTSPYNGMENNPVMYVDPDGEFIFLVAAAATYFMFFTETGYDVQKYVSPVAVNIDVKFGSHQRGIGVNTSVGFLR